METKKNVLITGASSGIGKATAARFSSKGHKVFGCARRLSRLEDVKDELGDNFHPVQADIGQKEDIDSLFSQVRNECDSLDVLINNAGVGYETTLIEGNPKHWEEMIRVNLLATAFCTRKALDTMVERDSGHIITVSSMSAHRVTDGGGVYSASKYGVRALIEGLRTELATKKSKVRTTLVSPGFVETEFYDQYYHKQDKCEIDKMFLEMQSLRSSDVVDAIYYAYQAPDHVGVNDILMRPLEQVS